MIDEVPGRGARWMSGKLTTESEPSVKGCSGSVMGAMRSTSSSTRRQLSLADDLIWTCGEIAEEV